MLHQRNCANAPNVRSSKALSFLCPICIGPRPSIHPFFELTINLPVPFELTFRLPACRTGVTQFLRILGFFVIKSIKIREKKWLLESELGERVLQPISVKRNQIEVSNETQIFRQHCKLFATQSIQRLNDRLRQSDFIRPLLHISDTPLLRIRCNDNVNSQITNSRTTKPDRDALAAC